MPGSFRTTGHANRVNRGGHMIFLKNRISIHPHPLQLTGGVCFVFLFLYFKSDRFVGQAEQGLGANLMGEEPGGATKTLHSSYKTRKGALDEPLLETLEKCLPCSGPQSRLRLQPSDLPFRVKAHYSSPSGCCFQMCFRVGLGGAALLRG